MATPIDLNTEPRFVGHLRRKLCKVGLGVGCGKGKEKERYEIEPQEINYVQPLVIQAIGKPIPAVPAVAGVNKKPNSRKDIQETFQKFQNSLEGYNLFNNKLAALGNLNLKPFTNSLGNVVMPNSIGLSGSETGYSPVYSNPRLDINTNSYGGDPPIAPPPIVFKSPRPNIFGSPFNGPHNSYLDLSSSGQTNNLVRNPHSIPDHMQSHSNIFSTPLPSIVKADLLNTYQGLNAFDNNNNINSFPPTNPSPDFSNLIADQSTPPLVVTPVPFFHQLTSNQGSLDLFSNNIRQLPQIIRLNNKPTPKIQVIDITARPKKEALSSSFGSSTNLHDEEGEKVVKHIHVHKHIHQMNEDTTAKVFKSVKDNLDAFSTSLLSTSDPEFVSTNTLKRFLKNSKRESQRNFDANSVLNLVKNNLGSCVCVPKQKCPSHLISDSELNRREDMTFVQNPRNKPNGSPILSTSSMPRAEALKGRVISKNETDKIKQVIKPRLKNIQESSNETQSTETNERKIVLNIKRVNNRESNPINNDSDVNYDSIFKLLKENGIMKNEEGFGITNKKLFKRDISHFLDSSKRFKQIESNCDTSKSSSTLARLKRSPSPQFVRIDEDENKSPRDPAQDRAREQDQKGGRSEGAAAGKNKNFEEKILHEKSQPRILKTIGQVLSKLPLHKVNLGLHKNPQSSGQSNYPGIHSMSFASQGFHPSLESHSLGTSLHPMESPLHPTYPHPAYSNFYPPMQPNAPVPPGQKVKQTASGFSFPESSSEFEEESPYSPFEASSAISLPYPLSPYPPLYPIFNNLDNDSTKKNKYSSSTDLHDQRIYYKTRFPTRDTEIPSIKVASYTPNACSFVNCKELTYFCPSYDLKNRHSRQLLNTHITGNDLPFSCGLHEVCCNLDNIGASLNNVGVIVPSRHTSESRTCGRSTVDAIKGRITGGLPTRGETKFGEFPWQAAILKKEGNDNVYVCAGSLIDKSHVLTAAHCVEGYTAGLLRVRLGEWDVNRDTEFYPHIEYDVVGLAIHPNFYSGNLINDIAIVRMLYPIDLNKMPHISPVCLPTPGFSFAGSRCWVSGWGKSAFGKSGKYQNLLKKVDVPIIPRQTCNAILRETRLGPGYSLHPGMMCAGGEPKRDACKGDGGGPLSCRDVDGNFVLSGIVSWGIGCGQPGVPGIYINVEHYVGWIRQMIDS